MNVAPSERPQDVYVEVANLVEEKRKMDAENGVEMAKLLEGILFLAERLLILFISDIIIKLPYTSLNETSIR